MIIPPAHRTESVKEYYFSLKNREIATINADRQARGEAPVINLGIGSPDGFPPLPAVEALCASAREKGSHCYQSYTGLPALRQAFADWYAKWYGVTLDPAAEIQPLVGSKEGILLLCLAFLNPGDRVLIPDPGYPTYSSAARLTGAEIVPYDLTAENGWLPDFEAMEKAGLEGVKMMWVNYPHMPTGARASEALYERLVAFGLKHKILVVNDNPYSFILNDRPLSILAVPGAKACCLELNSLSKAHNMAGWRIGMVGGGADCITEILKVKSQMDSGMFKPLQVAAVEALQAGPEWFAALNGEYRRRREAVGRLFKALGAVYDPDSAGLFVWGRIVADNPRLAGTDPAKTLGERLSDCLLYGAGVFITPGFIFGRNGADYIRASLCAPVETIEKAIDKI